MSDAELTVLCANDDEDARRTTVDALDAAGMDPVALAAVTEVTEALDRDVDCVVTAAELPDGDGFDVVQTVRETAPDVPVIVFADDPPQPDDVPPDQVVEFLTRSVPDARERLVSLVSEATLGAYQVAYPVPSDERERIETLRAYDVEDRDAVDAFDRITKLLTSHFDIDVAFVGLLDEHEERFVACEGADWRTLAREDTICTHTILESDDVMVVEDVTEDPRFAGNDRLRELDIRSYAGARLTTPSGHAIGALCCIDDEPRHYTDEELADLELFADEVMEQLVLRRRLREVDSTVEER